jgi:exodeoxyribonuclease VII small subunit
MARARDRSTDAPGDGAGELDYEKAMEELEGLVERMEQGEVPLEEALKAFERGRALVARCTAILEDAEKRIRQLDLDRLQGGETQ